MQPLERYLRRHAALDHRPFFKGVHRFDVDLATVLMKYYRPNGIWWNYIIPAGQSLENDPD